MTAIEEMYKTYGVGKKIMCEWTCRDSDICNIECEHYQNRKEVYPPFTAKKQLEIVQYIGLERGFKIVPNEAMDYILMDDVYADDKLNKQGYGYGFEQALVDLLLKLKDYLDHAKVKEILE